MDPYAFKRSGSFGSLVIRLESDSTEEKEGWAAVRCLEEGPAVTEWYESVCLFGGEEFGSSLESPSVAEDTELNGTGERVGDFSRET